MSGELSLPIPSTNARAESFDDGSIRIVDTLPRDAIWTYMAFVAMEIRSGKLEPPARFEIGIAGGGGQRIEPAPGKGPAEVAAQLASFLEGIVARRKDLTTGPGDRMVFSFTLACGCGVRIEEVPAPPAVTAN